MATETSSFSGAADNNNQHRFRWLVYGAGGWIGSMLCAEIERQLPDDVVVRGEARVDDTRAVSAELDRVQPDRVVCAVGRTHGPGCGTIDYLEGGGADRTRVNVRDNLFAPVSLGLECARRRTHMTYVGTGCIFNYDDGQPQCVPDGVDETQCGFREDDEPNFFGSCYSVVKGYTDRLLHAEPLASFVLNARIRMPLIGADHPRNFVTKIASYQRVIDVPNSVTVLDELVPTLIDMAQLGLVGTYNLTNPGTVSHNEVLSAYKRHLAPSFEWTNFTLDEQRSILKADRSNNRLNASLVARLYPNQVTPAREAIERMFEREAERRCSGAAAAASHPHTEN